MKNRTLVTHPPRIRLHEDNAPLVSPIYQSVKFNNGFGQMNQPDRFFYSRFSNPTVRELEILLATLQRREDGIAVASGVASIFLPLVSLLKAQDHAIIMTECYSPTRAIARRFLNNMGVEVSFVPFDGLADCEEHIKSGQTKVLFFESPSNPLLRIPDIERVVALAQKHKIITIMDNTLAGFHQHGQFEVDIFVHSLTKFASGHGDVMGGVVLGDRRLIEPMKKDAVLIGSTLDPHSAFLTLRGMKTYFVRYAKQSENALELARWLSTRSEVRSVCYPLLESHPEFALAQKQLEHGGTVISLELENHVPTERFVSKLHLFQYTGSLGSTDSLVIDTKKPFASDLPEAEVARMGFTDHTVRLSVGLEDVQDLIEDLEAALAP